MAAELAQVKQTVDEASLPELAQTVNSLDKMKVLEDHFFVNKDGYRHEQNPCFDPVLVQPGQTFETSAVVNTANVPAATGTGTKIWLIRSGKSSGEWVAYSENFNPADYNGMWSNAPSSLDYREKVQSDEPVYF